jgi:hypothetical protein
MQDERRRESRLAVAILLLAAMTPSAVLAWRFRDVPDLGTFHDDGIYLVSAQSLARNGEYRIASLPGEPYQTKYPPLYPLLLSLSWRLAPSFPANVPCALLLTWAALPFYLVLAFVLFRDLGFGELPSAFLCLVLGWNFHVTLVSIRLLSDLTFSCLLLASLVIGERAAKRSSSSSLCLLSGLVAGAAYLTRTAGLPLLISSPLCFLLRKQPLRAALFLVALLPSVLGWQLWVSRHLSSQADPLMLYYTDYFGYYRYNVSWHELPSLFSRNLAALTPTLESLLTASLTVAFPGFDPLFLLALLSLAGVGFLVTRGLAWHYSVFGFSSLLLVLLWHYPPTPRFLLPLDPLLLAGLAIVLRSFFQSLVQSPLVRRPLFRVPALSIFGAGLSLLLVWYVQTFEMVVTTLESMRSRAQAQEPTFDWIARSLPASATFLAYHDPDLYLHTGRHAAAIHVPPRFFEDPSAIEGLFASQPEFAARHGLQYLLVTPTDFDREFARDRLRLVLGRLVGEPSIFQRLHQAPEAVVYQFQPERQAAP